MFGCAPIAALTVSFALASAGCLGSIEPRDSSRASSPSDPAAFDASMFDAEALAGLSTRERAYVKGHALAVYTYGKTLPTFVGHKGYPYEPGISGPEAAVPYVWAEVMVARSGGVDGTGALFVECEDGDDVCIDGDAGDPEDPPQEPEDPHIDDDCEEFLDPAAMDARYLLAAVSVSRVLGQDDGVAARAEFDRGIGDALALEDLDEDTDHSEVEMLKDDVQDYGMCDHSPLILDLAGDGLAIGKVADGARFDLRAEGAPVRAAWPAGEDDAFVVIDWNDNGTIDDGSELFGNAAGFANGFEALAVVDTRARGGNGDGVVDARDALFSRLGAWRDRGGDGVAERGEVIALDAAGVQAIALDYAASRKRDANGNRHAQRGSFTRSDGSAGAVVDVWLRYRRSHVVAKHQLLRVRR